VPDGGNRRAPNLLKVLFHAVSTYVKQLNATATLPDAFTICTGDERLHIRRAEIKSQVHLNRVRFGAGIVESKQQASTNGTLPEAGQGCSEVQLFPLSVRVAALKIRNSKHEIRNKFKTPIENA
jgi:hypothetical protein